MSRSAAIRILLVGAPGSAFRAAAEMAREAGAEAGMAGNLAAALEWLRAEGGDLVLIDVGMDVAGFIACLRAERIAVPVLACGIDAPAARAVAAIRAGAFDYIPLPPQRDLIAAAILSVGQRETALIGEDPAFAKARDFARAIAPSPAPVLISGGPGSGRETMARAIHVASGRAGRFVAVECAGVSAEILDSELFGHEPGAFPGALAVRAGRLREAAGGTLLLREIGALPAAAQARLAETLAAQDFHSGARIIASTSEDLRARVSAATFRADLFARLALLRIELPSLASRGEDIPLLARHLVRRLASATGGAPKPIDEAALALLRTYAWPGNVRELEDVLHRALLLARGQEIGPDALVLSDGSGLIAAPAGAPPDAEVGTLIGRPIAEIERDLILGTLARFGGNRTAASAILGISVRTMRNKLKAFAEAGIPVSPAA